MRNGFKGTSTIKEIPSELTRTPQMPYEQKLISVEYWWYEDGWWQNNESWTTPRGFFEEQYTVLVLELDEYINFNFFPPLLFWYGPINLTAKNLNTFLKLERKFNSALHWSFENVQFFSSHYAVFHACLLPCILQLLTFYCKWWLHVCSVKNA